MVRLKRINYRVDSDLFKLFSKTKNKTSISKWGAYRNTPLYRKHYKVVENNLNASKNCKKSHDKIINNLAHLLTNIAIFREIAPYMIDDPDYYNITVSEIMKQLKYANELEAKILGVLSAEKNCISAGLHKKNFGSVFFSILPISWINIPDLLKTTQMGLPHWISVTSATPNDILSLIILTLPILGILRLYKLKNNKPGMPAGIWFGCRDIQSRTPIVKTKIWLTDKVARRFSRVIYATCAVYVALYVAQPITWSMLENIK